MISPRLITTLCPPEKYLDAMVSSVITDYSVPAGLDIAHLLRVEKVTAVDVVTLVTRARPATLGLFKPCPVNSQQLRRVYLSLGGSLAMPILLRCLVMKFTGVPENLRVHLFFFIRKCKFGFSLEVS